MIREACVESLDEALLAAERGANRLELCSDLDQDGLTPATELIDEVYSAIQIPLRVMIRPRAGNFVYTEKEIKKMLQAIERCKLIGVDGVVIGVLDYQNELDSERMNVLSEAAAPLKVTMHKAIDLSPDPLKVLAALLKIPGITGVLTSGGAATAEGGMPVLQQMIEAAAGNLEIIAAGKVTSENLAYLHEQLGAMAYHGRKIVGDLTAEAR